MKYNFLKKNFKKVIIKNKKKDNLARTKQKISLKFNIIITKELVCLFIGTL